MATQEIALPGVKQPGASLIDRLHGLVVTVDHKKLGLMYVGTAIAFLVVAGSKPPFEIKRGPAPCGRRYLRRRTRDDNRTAGFPSAGPHINDIVAGCNNIKVMLHDYHRVSQFDQPIEL